MLPLMAQRSRRATRYTRYDDSAAATFSCHHIDAHH